jgi:hypothetical protein
LEAPLASREAGQFAAEGFYFRHAIPNPRRGRALRGDIP